MVRQLGEPEFDPLDDPEYKCRACGVPLEFIPAPFARPDPPSVCDPGCLCACCVGTCHHENHR